MYQIILHKCCAEDHIYLKQSSKTRVQHVNASLSMKSSLLPLCPVMLFV